MGRTLRGKVRRNTLWVAAGGKCEHCGCELEESWHADHVIPWKVTHRTNIHEMQALCADCNRKKGAKLPLRKFQQELVEFFEAVQGGQEAMPPLIAAHICPGGGKQGAAAIFAHYLINRLKIVDRVCWITPNAALREQACDSLLPSTKAKKNYVRDAVGYNLRFFESVNTPNPAKDGQGYALTYPALRADAGHLNLDQFRQYRYGLIGDEIHHLSEDKVTMEHIAPLFQMARARLFMTGTLDRHDRAPIYGLPYGLNRMVDTRTTPQIKWITYTQQDALDDHAIVPVRFRHIDARAEWLEEGRKQEASTLGRSWPALWTALNSEYADALLATCLEAWRGYRLAHPTSKMLVVCANKEQARRALQSLRSLGEKRVDLAVSRSAPGDESGVDDPNSMLAIRQFKGLVPGREVDILVTVMMAYEGLDVPEITHLACLTHIRSRPWIEQMIARSWRYDSQAGRWDEQVAWVFCPDDEPMQACIKAIKEGQIEALRRQGPPGGGGGIGGGGGADDPITPLVSAPTLQWVEELGPTDVRVEIEEFDELLAVQREVNIPWLDVLDLKKIKDAFLHRAEPEEEPVMAGSGGGAYQQSPTEELRQLKKHLDDTVRSYAARLCLGDRAELPLKIRSINTEVLSRFGERAAMTAPQVREAISFVRGWYGDDDA